MEYVDGEPLTKVLERGRLSVAAAVAYARQALEALAYAHRRGVAHCDVSPANILIARDGAVKLTDFGLARAASESDWPGAGVPAGSPWQMAPEQARGSGGMDARTDVYGMGAVLYEMLSGRKLFDAEGMFAILKAQLETAPAPVRRHNPEVPPALEAAVAKALAKDPAARFQNADEFRAAIERAVRGRRRVPLQAAAVIFAMALLPRVTSGPGAPPATAMVAEAPPAPVEDAPAEAAPAAPEPPKIRELPRKASTRRAAPAAAASELANTAVALPEAPAVAEPEGPPELEVPAADLPAPAAPPAAAKEEKKSGNRFVRALGKLNPFRRNKEK
jgi:serine/threonine-protein kinase